MFWPNRFIWGRYLLTLWFHVRNIIKTWTCQHSKTFRGCWTKGIFLINRVWIVTWKVILRQVNLTEWTICILVLIKIWHQHELGLIWKHHGAVLRATTHRIRVWIFSVSWIGIQVHVSLLRRVGVCLLKPVHHQVGHCWKAILKNWFEAGSQPWQDGLRLGNLIIVRWMFPLNPGQWLNLFSITQDICWIELVVVVALMLRRKEISGRLVHTFDQISRR